MRIQQQFLLVAAVGLTPIALGYGLQPSTSLAYLFEIDASSINSRHIFRAVMGLYLALVLFWVLGAFIKKYQLPALYSLTVFMFGLAFGRTLSLIFDGWPHWLLVVYLLLEVGFGLVGIAMIKKTEKEG
ncbi:DUF4345 domain-containing protein [Shewanella sp. 10N.261.52.F9]|uniref:DUF4345 domain-containing protein n=1 Tax=Shewanella sp. 10N.261.52.F9 TaxID=3229684 RepID=UPI00354E762E